MMELPHERVALITGSGKRRVGNAVAARRSAYSVLDTTKYHALGGPAMPTWQEALKEYFA